MIFMLFPIEKNYQKQILYLPTLKDTETFPETRLLFFFFDPIASQMICNETFIISYLFLS